MHMKESLVNFLYDQNYFVTIYSDCIYIYDYKELLVLKENNIDLKFENFILNIEGKNLFIKKMFPKELLIKGKITNIGFSYE